MGVRSVWNIVVWDGSETGLDSNDYQGWNNLKVFFKNFVKFNIKLNSKKINFNKFLKSIFSCPTLDFSSMHFLVLVPRRNFVSRKRLQCIFSSDHNFLSISLLFYVNANQINFLLLLRFFNLLLKLWEKLLLHHFSPSLNTIHFYIANNHKHENIDCITLFNGHKKCTASTFHRNSRETWYLLK